MQAAATAYCKCRKILQLPLMTASPGLHCPLPSWLLLFPRKQTSERQERSVGGTCSVSRIPPSVLMGLNSDPQAPGIPASFLLREYEGLQEKPHRPRQEAKTEVEFGHYPE